MTKTGFVSHKVQIMLLLVTSKNNNKDDFHNFIYSFLEKKRETISPSGKQTKDDLLTQWMMKTMRYWIAP